MTLVNRVNVKKVCQIYFPRRRAAFLPLGRRDPFSHKRFCAIMFIALCAKRTKSWGVVIKRGDPLFIAEGRNSLLSGIITRRHPGQHRFPLPAPLIFRGVFYKHVQQASIICRKLCHFSLKKLLILSCLDYKTFSQKSKSSKLHKILVTPLSIFVPKRQVPPPGGCDSIVKFLTTCAIILLKWNEKPSPRSRKGFVLTT